MVAFVLRQLCEVPARGVVVSASAAMLVGRKFDSRPGLTKTLQIGTVALLPGARCTEELQGTQPELQGTQPEHKRNRVKMNPEYKLRPGATRPL